MNACNVLRGRALPVFLAGFGVLVASIRGAENDHLRVPTTGGMTVIPVITEIQVKSNQATVTWQNCCGPYRLLRKNSLKNASWQVVAGPLLSNSATVSVASTNAYFRVSAAGPQFAGALACAECHSSIHESELATRHAGALETLKAIGQGSNPACLPCHTVGYGTETGYVNEKKTPRLAGVQCENCHGPAALHAANEQDLAVRPRIELAGQLCGGCHIGSDHPTYTEWASSGHAGVVEDMNPSSRINSCGRCHSGSARLALLKGEDPAITVTGDANVGIVCITCHDPHRVTANDHQLRNPLASTNNFSMTSGVFTNLYDPNINICAQCHNDRGGTWTGTSRPPHHSVQYNLLLGAAGEVTNGIMHRIGAHGRIEKQCVTCHMQTEEYVSEASPAVTGHTFRVDRYDSCRECHPLPDLLAEFTALVFSNRIQQVKGNLDLWAVTKAPAELRTNYGVLSWEYVNTGELSVGTNSPPTSKQSLIPNAIKLARFNLYLINNDGSHGIHNPLYALDLLDLADEWVLDELNK